MTIKRTARLFSKHNVHSVNNLTHLLFCAIAKFEAYMMCSIYITLLVDYFLLLLWIVTIHSKWLLKELQDYFLNTMYMYLLII